MYGKEKFSLCVCVYTHAHIYTHVCAYIHIHFYVILHAVLGSVWLFATPWTVARQASLSMGFSRQEYWSGLPCPLPGDLPNPETEPASPVSPEMAGGFFYPWVIQERPTHTHMHVCMKRKDHPKIYITSQENSQLMSFFRMLFLLFNNVQTFSFTNIEIRTTW